jgi:Excisionase-like protein
MKIPLLDWARRHYSKPPSAYVLRQWARNGEIVPPPERVGKEWHVSEDAQRLPMGRPSLLSRL